MGIAGNISMRHAAYDALQGEVLLIALICVTGIVQLGCVKRVRDAKDCAPVECLKRTVGIELPSGSTQVHCKVESLMTLFLYARVDVPTAEMATWMASPPLLSCPPPKQNSELEQQFGLGARDLSWWAKTSDAVFECSSYSWETRRWRHAIHIGLSPRGEMTRVYLVYIEEANDR